VLLRGYGCFQSLISNFLSHVFCLFESFPLMDAIERFAALSCFGARDGFADVGTIA
jgi:hypothetical protein